MVDKNYLMFIGYLWLDKYEIVGFLSFMEKEFF